MTRALAAVLSLAAILAQQAHDRDAVHRVTIDPTIGQQAYLKASNTGVSDSFGFSVAMSGDTVVVGARFEDSAATGINGDQSNNSALDAGAAYVFVRNGATWSQQAYLKASNTGAGDNFGWSVAVSGDTVVVGASGEDSAATGLNGDQSDNSAVDSGAAYVFVRSGTTWSQQAYLKASNTGAGDTFGHWVVVSGDTLVVAADREDSAATGVNGDQNNNSAVDSGAAYVFVRSGTTWSQQAYIKASNTGAGDAFGFSPTISGDTLVVGAIFEDSAATGINLNQSDNSAIDAGAVYVFVRSSGSWTQQAYLKASNTGAGDWFGRFVAVSGDTVVVGAPREDSAVAEDQSNNSALEAGAAYVFVRSGGLWSQQAYLKASDTGAGNYFGWSVAVGFAPAVSSDIVAVGAPSLGGSVGAAYVFVRSGTIWSQQAYLEASNTGTNDQFGFCIAVSGDSGVVGAVLEDSAATGVNGDQSSNAAADSGAAYVFAATPLAVNVSAASYLGPALASDSIVAAFGTNLATQTLAAATQPLPTSLAGTTVKVRDSLGIERSAPLFFVSPSQINYYMPTGTALGQASVTIVNGSGVVPAADVQVTRVAPGLFSANSDGQGLGAALGYRVSSNGTQGYFDTVRYDSATQRIVAIPLDLGPATDQVFLILFGTGIRYRSSLSGVTATLAGTTANVAYADAQGGYVGLDQVNLLIPRSLAGRGEVNIGLTVDGKTANTIRVNIK